MIYDVAVIGAGVVGALTARELSRFELSVCVVEKESDVAMGSTKANSAIIHSGYDAKPGSLKAKLNVLGNSMMDLVCSDLGIPFKKIGSLMLAFDDKDMEQSRILLDRGIRNGVSGLAIMTGDDIRRLEPHISENSIGALYAPTAGIVCPYELTVGAAENAALNGAEIKLEFDVKSIRSENGYFILQSSKDEVKCRYIVNAAGLFADDISAMVGEEDFSIRPRKGEYLLLDKSQGRQISNIIFQSPSVLGKGVLVTPTVDGNLLIGPNAVDGEDKEDVSTSVEGLNQVIQAALKSVPSLSLKDVVTSFAGLRAVPSTGDFIIGASRKVKGFINAAGIESPGLSASPAIAEFIVRILNSEGLKLKMKADFNPIREPVRRLRFMDDADKLNLIKKNSRYGRIICRCEGITEGEIVDCIRRPLGATNLDAVKRRTRSGMGRCQGGFCTPRLVEILSRELQIPMEEVTKKGGNSKLLFGRTK